MQTTMLTTAAAALAVGLLIQPALAADGKAMPGSACQGSSFRDLEPLFRGNGVILSVGTQRVQIHCPVVKDATRIRSAEVMLIDRNPDSGADIKCSLATLRRDGSTLQFQTLQSSSSFEVALPITFGAQGTVSGGTYMLACELPPVKAGRGPSAIVGYTVVED